MKTGTINIPDEAKGTKRERNCVKLNIFSLAEIKLYRFLNN
jgi:hypothetical protein